MENFQGLSTRQRADDINQPGPEAKRVNLLNWDGKGRPAGLFPPVANPNDRAEKP